MNMTGLPNQPSWDLRNGFQGWVLAVLWMVFAFILFQVVGTIVGIGLLFGSGRVDFSEFDPNQVFENLDLIFIGNTVGQILVLGLMTFWLTSLSTNRLNRTNFLRIKRPVGGYKTIALALVLIVAIQPVSLFLSWINMQIPFPDWYMNFEENQLKIFEEFLSGGHFLPLTLFHVAMVPAFCEELMFRGYVLRQFERDFTPYTAIILTGVFFGLFHIRFSQIIPLIVLGILITWIAWKSGSIWVAVAIHFLNNAASIMAATFYPEFVFGEAMKSSMPPPLLVITSIVISAFLLYYLNNDLKQDREEAYAEPYQTG